MAVNRVQQKALQYVSYRSSSLPGVRASPYSPLRPQSDAWVLLYLSGEAILQLEGSGRELRLNGHKLNEHLFLSRRADDDDMSSSQMHQLYTTVECLGVLYLRAALDGECKRTDKHQQNTNKLRNLRI